MFKNQSSYQKIEDHMKSLIASMDKDQAISYAISSISDILKTFSLTLFDERLNIALDKAKAYHSYKTYRVSDIRKEALICHQIARSSSDLKDVHLARLIGQGISTIHVKTHALGILYYLDKLLHDMHVSNEDIDQYFMNQLSILNTYSK
jgi:hypothetical protein